MWSLLLLCRSVSTRQLERVELCKGPLVAALAQMSVEVHAGVVAAADKFFLELRRRYALSFNTRGLKTALSEGESLRYTKLG